LIIGNMAELGPTAEQLHRDVAAYAATRGIDELWCVGPYAPAQVDEYARHSASVRARAFADNAAVIDAYRAEQIPAVVLIKGSRSAAMEIIVAALCGHAITEGH
jgi:UDP-N-acetylmuramoyl-tripeptide--D-alanyl-D-alanine ligase